MKPVDRGSESECQSPALSCQVIPGPSLPARMAAGAPAPPISPPSTGRAAAVLPPSAQEQNPQLVFIQALKPPPKSFLAFAALAAASALPITVVSGSRLDCV